MGDLSVKHVRRIKTVSLPCLTCSNCHLGLTLQSDEVFGSKFLLFEFSLNCWVTVYLQFQIFQTLLSHRACQLNVLFSVWINQNLLLFTSKMNATVLVPHVPPVLFTKERFQTHPTPLIKSPMDDQCDFYQC